MKDALKLSKEAAEGLLAIADFVPGTGDVTRDYAAAYHCAWAYDALNILAKAIQTTGEDRAKIRDAILAMHDYKGVLGTFSFTPNGDGLHEVSVVRIANGSPKLEKVVNVSAGF